MGSKIRWRNSCIDSSAFVGVKEDGTGALSGRSACWAAGVFCLILSAFSAK